MPEVWDQRRLRELVDDVGEAGVRDLLRLFQADMAFLMAQLASGHGVRRRTTKFDMRTYGTGAQMLVDLGLTSIRIMTNNPKKIIGLQGYGLSVTEQVPIEADPNEHNVDYLRTKRDRMEHALHHQGLAFDEEMIQQEAERDRQKQASLADSSVEETE